MAQDPVLELIFSKTIALRYLSAGAWTFVDLPISAVLKDKLKQAGYQKLADINNVPYARIYRACALDANTITELYALIISLHTPDEFFSIGEAVLAAKNKREDEAKQQSQSAAQPNDDETTLQETAFAPQAEESRTNPAATQSEQTEKIWIPSSLKALPLEYLAPSEKLMHALAEVYLLELGQLNGLLFETLRASQKFNDDVIAELKQLIEFAVKFHDVKDFDLFKAISQRRAWQDENKSRKDKASQLTAPAGINSERTFKSNSTQDSSRNKKTEAAINPTNYEEELARPAETDDSNVIDIPQRLVELPIGSLAPSLKLRRILRRNNKYLLGSLHKIFIDALVPEFGFDEESVLELLTLIRFAKSFGFSTKHDVIWRRAVERRDAARKVPKESEISSAAMSNNQSQPNRIPFAEKFRQDDYVVNQGEKNSFQPKAKIELIEVPQSLLTLPMSYLAPSSNLEKALLKVNKSKLGQLHGVNLLALAEIYNFDEAMVAELRTLLAFAKSVQSSGFGQIKREADKRRRTKTIAPMCAASKPATIVQTQLQRNDLRGENRTRSEQTQNLWQSKPQEPKIAVPESFKKASISAFSISAKLTSLFARRKIFLVGDLEKFTFADLKRTHGCGEKTLEELRRFLKKLEPSSTQSAKLKIVEQPAQKPNTTESDFSPKVVEQQTDAAQTQFEPRSLGVQAQSDLRKVEEFADKYKKEILPAYPSLTELLEFINDFLTDLPAVEREILIDRFGGSFDAKIRTYEEIAQKQQISSVYARQLQLKAVEKLKNRLINAGETTLEKLRHDCLAAVTPLTPLFLVSLTQNNYEVFSYAPAFYIRLFSRLSPKLIALPEIKNQLAALTENAANIASQIKAILKNNLLPVPLTGIFAQVMTHVSNNADAEKDFFEAVQSVNFVIIQSEKPAELLLELNRE